MQQSNLFVGIKYSEIKHFIKHSLVINLLILFIKHYFMQIEALFMVIEGIYKKC
jgi:hypothetical protein